MYSQSYTGNPCPGAGYYDPSYQQYYYQQQQQNQFANNSMGYYSPEALVMLYSQYQQRPSAYHYQPQLDYQTTPALYFLNQQAELLQKSFAAKPAGQRKTRTTSGGSKGSRKQRTNKALSPTPSADFATETDHLSKPSGASNDSSTPTKRLSDCSLDPEQQAKQRKLEPSTVPVHGACSGSKRSIFRSVALMAESSCSQ